MNKSYIMVKIPHREKRYFPVWSHAGKYYVRRQVCKTATQAKEISDRIVKKLNSK